jgi:hypothetical protein
LSLQNRFCAKRAEPLGVIGSKSHFDFRSFLLCFRTSAAGSLRSAHRVFCLRSCFRVARFGFSRAVIFSGCLPRVRELLKSSTPLQLLLALLGFVDLSTCVPRALVPPRPHLAFTWESRSIQQQSREPSVCRRQQLFIFLPCLSPSELLRFSFSLSVLRPCILRWGAVC